MTTKIQLRAAKIPSIIGYIAVHYWFVIIKNNQKERWEIWQNRHKCSTSWGHLHQNLMSYDSGVGNGKSWLEMEWTGEEANLLAEIIENSPQIYPYNYYYLYYPGPNSNTYVQWILQQANINYMLGALGIGKDYTHKIGLHKYNKVIHFSMLFLVGIKFIKYTEFELNILGFTLGIRLKPLLLKLPFNFSHNKTP